MKRISLIFVLSIFASMLFLQFSCIAIKEPPTEGMPVEVEEAPEVIEEAEAIETVEESAGVVLLADTHKAAGVECSDCHMETPPANDVPTSNCMTCHEDYRDVALSAIDPHNAHVEFTNCGDCHHSHQESENQCNSCHSFSLKAP